MEDIKAEEIWKDIKGYEGLYQVSNFGRIKSLERVTKYRNSKRVLREKIKGDFIGKRGYKRVELTKDGISKKYNLHRIVASSFISNPYNKKEVNHINGIKTDNRVENLEWCTSQENTMHAIKMGLQKNSDKQRKTVGEYARKNKVKKIVQLTKDGKYIKTWESAVAVERKVGIKSKSISQCVTGRSKTAGGYRWVLYEQFENMKYVVGDK